MKPEPLDLENIEIPDNTIAQACFNTIMRGLTKDEIQTDSKEEALDCVFDLLTEFRNEIREKIKSVCEFFLKELEEIEGDSRSDEDIMRTIKAKFRSAFKDILGGEA